MKDLPLKPLISNSIRTILPATTAVQASAAELPEPLTEIARSAEASIVNVPRTRALTPASDEKAVLQSFLSEVRNQKDIDAAHGGLDASRVFDLLSDD